MSSSQSYIEWFVVSVDILGGDVRLQFGADVGRGRCILDKAQEVAAIRRGRMKLKCERQMVNLDKALKALHLNFSVVEISSGNTTKLRGIPKYPPLRGQNKVIGLLPSTASLE